MTTAAASASPGGTSRYCRGSDGPGIDMRALEEEETDDESENNDTCSNMPDVVDVALRQNSVPAMISLENSREIHIGNRLNYNAPVTINQFVNVHKTEDANAEDVQQHAVKAPSYVNGFVVEKYPTSETPVRWFHGRRRLIWIFLGLLILLAIVVAIVLHFVLNTSPTDTTPDPTLVLNEDQRIYPREYWSNYPPRFTIPLEHPTPYVVISHSAEPGCNESIACSEKLRQIQSYHVSTFEQPDIGYNFIIDEAGNVYEGRGWDHTNFFQSFTRRRNVGVCFLGNYVYIELSEKQQKSLKYLLALGVKLGKLAEDYMLIAQSQTVATQSPGGNILKVIDSWPHRCLENCALPLNTTTTSTTEKSSAI